MNTLARLAVGFAIGSVAAATGTVIVDMWRGKSAVESLRHRGSIAKKNLHAVTNKK